MTDRFLVFDTHLTAECGFDKIEIDTDPTFRYGARLSKRFSSISDRRYNRISWHIIMDHKDMYTIEDVTNAVEGCKKEFINRYKEVPIKTWLEVVYCCAKESRGLYIVFEIGETEEERVVRIEKHEEEKKERRMQKKLQRLKEKEQIND